MMSKRTAKAVFVEAGFDPSTVVADTEKVVEAVASRFLAVVREMRAVYADSAPEDLVDAAILLATLQVAALVGAKALGGISDPVTPEQCAAIARLEKALRKAVYRHVQGEQRR